jgi:hypothetical protein
MIPAESRRQRYGVQSLDDSKVDAVASNVEAGAAEVEALALTLNAQWIA